MKKKFLFAALAAVTGLMTSCSDDEQLASDDYMSGNTIVFATSNGTHKSLTRSGVTINSLDKFTVTSVNPDNTTYFADELFTYDGSKFVSATPHYWPVDGTLSFYAISDPGTESFDSVQIPHYTYTNWSGEADLVAATVKTGTKTIPYPLTFQHLTSQIYVSACAEDTVNVLTYKLTSVKMTSPSTGTYNFAAATGGSGTWDIDNTQTSEYSYADDLPMSFGQKGSVKLTDCYWNILPVNDGRITFVVEYQVLQNGKVISDFTGSNSKTCIVEKPALISGKKYCYNFILSRGADDVITFTMAMVDWDDETLFSYSIPQMPTSISVTPESAMISLGSTKQLACTVSPESAVQDVTWQSSNEAVATVDADGLVTTVSKGTVKIIATSVNGLKDTCDVKVYDANGYEAVDLGLPSGTLWCNENVGADSPTGYGNYYAWGEVAPQDSGYCWATYKWANGTSSTITKYTSDYYFNNASPKDGLYLLEEADDAAHVNMGGDWIMPTNTQISELITNTYNKYVENYNGSGVNCWIFYKKKSSGTYSDSDTHIVLPFGGTIGGGATINSTNIEPSMVGQYLKYWTSILKAKMFYSDAPACAVYLSGTDDDIELCYDNGVVRCQGLPVRAIIKK